jgi:hypothetical protein
MYLSNWPGVYNTWNENRKKKQSEKENELTEATVDDIGIVDGKSCLGTAGVWTREKCSESQCAGTSR